MERIKKGSGLAIPLILLASLTISSTSYGWNRNTHQWLAKESLNPVAKEWHLEEPIQITSFDQFLKKFSKINPDIQTRDDFARWLKINPDSHFDEPLSEEKSNEKTTPLKILELYAPRADDGRDRSLPYERIEQFWFGSGTKTGSQAFRHMEKPPFHLLNPLNTFGFPLGRVGQASQRAQIYFDLAKIAYQVGEPYWGWNFLGCGLHYIQDLQNPYHSSQLMIPTAIEGMKSYLLWGKEKNWGMIKTVTHITSNLHHYFEGYTDHYLRNDPQAFSSWKKALQEGKHPRWEEIPKDMRQLAENIRDFSNDQAYQTVRATLQLTESRLLGEREYITDDDGNSYSEDPAPFFTPEEEIQKEARQEIFDIVLSSFQYQGEAIRYYVRSFLDQIK